MSGRRPLVGLPPKSDLPNLGYALQDARTHENWSHGARLLGPGVLSSESRKLGADLVYVSLHRWLRIRSQREVVLVGPDRAVAVAGRSCKVAFLPEERTQVDRTDAPVVGPTTNHRERAPHISFGFTQMSHEQIATLQQTP